MKNFLRLMSLNELFLGQKPFFPFILQVISFFVFRLLILFFELQNKYYDLIFS